MPKIPRIGCIGLIALVIASLVAGGVFLGVSKPGVHLPPGNLLTAEHPHHWTKTTSDWADKHGVVGLEVEIEGGHELEPDHTFTFVAEAKNAENMPENPSFDWAFKIDDEEPVKFQTNVDRIKYAFHEEGDYTIEVAVSDATTGELAAGAAYHHAEKSSGFGLTNTMICSWITVIFLLLLFGLGMRHRRLIPTGAQNVVEWIGEALLNFVEGAAGRENGRRFFPVFATIFLFVIVNSWLALLPIFNVIGWGHTTTYDTAFFGAQEGFVVSTTLLRSANTDINLPLAIALMSFIFVEFWGFSALGIRHYVAKFIKVGLVARAFGGLFKGKGPMPLLIAFIEAAVGGIELILEFMRIVSFTFRLFGNMTAGEVLLMMMAFLVPLFLPVAFYGLEFLVGFIQAMVFAGLTLGFAMIAVAPHEEEHE